ncbi:MAG: PD40 domain-containing protein [Bacteroidaceae bacterium]|nr:PD40 domain-containing protein [Bacteroidaceae bacterium]
MNTIRFSLFNLLVLLLLTACSKSYTVPTDAVSNGNVPVLYPDYTEVTVPANIAPLNFIVKGEADEYVVQVKASGKEVMVSGGGDDGVVQFDSTEWRSTLQANRGKALEITVYQKSEGQWTSYKPYKIYVAEEDIDPYLSYRLIEPGFEMYRQIGLYQRNLTTFEQNIIYENNREENPDENHCANCHNFQNYEGKNMLFHVRAKMGGTLIAKDGKVEKLNFKNDSILGSAVYPSWHPRKNYIVFSSNRTGQAFHLLDLEKIEVLDYGSDLLFYNADTHEVSNIFKTPDDMETFPAWAPDGKKIYYCCCPAPGLGARPDSLKVNYVLNGYQHLHYNLMSVTFDEKTMSFGEPQLELDCIAMGKSASVPRVSPDGRYLLFTLGDFGQFHIWHKSSDQYVKNLETGEVYPLTEANSPDVDSYHSWSSNGRWIAFSSRRDDGSYTRPYIAYFDKKGKARKAFMLPQEDPIQNLMLLKSYNVPELTKEPTAYTFDQLKDAVYTQNPGTDIKYKELRTPDQIKEQQKYDTVAIYPDGVPATLPPGTKPATDANTGASPKADAATGASPKAK